MILPSKHIRISESLLGLGGYLLKYLGNEPQSIDQLWFKVSKQNNAKKSFSYHSFDNLILSLNYLYIIGAIDINTEGLIYNASNQAISQ
jgi:hypothetical protein